MNQLSPRYLVRMWLVFGYLFWGVLFVGSAGAADYLDEQWLDKKRDRVVPVRLRIPKGAGPFPVLLLSHGLGGSRDNIAYLAEAAAADGWICISLQHAGSDEKIWKNKPIGKKLFALGLAMRNPQNGLNRVHDVAYVIDELTRLQTVTTHPLAGKAKLDQIALAGHSFGAWTAFACAGRQAKTPKAGALAGTVIPMEKRVRAIVALSPQGEPTAKREEVACKRIRVPSLSVTGGHDTVPLQPQMTPENRCRSFHALPPEAGNGYLLWFDDANHMTFNGPGASIPGMRRNHKTDGQISKVVAAISIAFLRYELFRDPEAKAKLLGWAATPSPIKPTGYLKIRPAGTKK